MQGPRSCEWPVMDDPLRPDPVHDRIARVVTRLNAASARASQAHEQLILARDRLAAARRVLLDARASEVPTPALGVNPLELDEPP